MLTEIQRVRQIDGEGFRRWFTDPSFDLIVWYDERGGCIGFQLCYDKLRGERSFTWREGHGSQLDRVDDGSTAGHVRASPVMVSSAELPGESVIERFLEESTQVDGDIVLLVADTIRRRSAPLQETRRSRA
jgi:hypothetical protein